MKNVRWRTIALQLRALLLPLLATYSLSVYAGTTAGGAVQGTLFAPGGLPVTSSSVNFKLQVMDKSGTCVLYEESHNGVNLSTTNGDFSFDLGTGTSASNKINGTSVLDASVFRNDANLPSFTGCPTGVTLTSGDERLLRVQFDVGTGLTTLSPDMKVQGGAYSAVAETLQGKTPSDFITTQGTAAGNLQQTNVEYAFSLTNWQRLKDLIDGVSSSYLPTAGTGAFNFGARVVTGISTPGTTADAVNKGYADAYIGGKATDLTSVGAGFGNGRTLVWDQVQNKWVTGIASDSTKLPLAGGTMAGNITMGGYDLLNVGNIVQGVQKTHSLGRFTSLEEATLVATLGTGSIGMSWYNTDLKTYKIWDGANAITQAYLSSVGTSPGTLNSAWFPATGVGAGTYGGTATIPVFTVGADGRLTAAYGTAISGVTPGGLAGGDLTGSYPNPLIAPLAVTTAKLGDNAITAAKIKSTGVAINRLIATDPVTPNTLTYFECPINDQIMMWTTNGWDCTTVAALSPVKTVASRTPDALGNVPLTAYDISGIESAATKDYGTAAGELVELDGAGKIPSSLLPVGTGTITSVSAASPLSGGGASGAVTVSIDVGTGANQVVQLNASAQIPAVDGSLLTGVNASKIGTRTVTSAAPTPNQVLAWNGSQWEPTSTAVGSMTGVVSGSGLIAGTITSYGTLAVDLGTAANKVVQFDGSARYPANDGSLITNVNAVRLQSYFVSATAPSANQLLKWNGSQWEPTTDTGTGTITTVVSGAGLVAGTITNSGTIAVDVGTAANQVVQLNGSSQIPAVDGSLLTGVNASKIGTRAVTSTAPTPNQVLGWNGSQWEPMSAAIGSMTGVVSGAGMVSGTITSYGTVAVDVGTGANKVVQFDGSARYPANDGSLITNVNAVRLQSQVVSATAPTANQILKWNGSQWEPSTDTGTGTVTSVVSGTGLVAGTITNNGTIAVDVGTGANQVVQLNSSSQIPAVDGSLLTNVNASTIGTRAIATTLPTANQILTWNGSRWEPMAASNSLSWPLLATPGTASEAAPSYAFASDSDTGFYSPGMGTAALATNGTTRMTIDSSGNVGIGTTSPGSPLDINGDVRISGTGRKIYSDFSTSGASGNYFQTTSANGGTWLRALPNGTSRYSGFVAYGNSDSTNSGIVSYGINDMVNNVASVWLTRLGSGTAPDYSIYNASGASIFYAQQAGNVGIGTAAPGSVALDVVGTGANNSAILVPRLTTALRPAGANGMIRYNTNTNKFEFFENNAWVNYGTGASGSTSFPLLASPGTTPSTAPSYAFASDSDTGFYSPGVGTAALATNGTARMTINSSGYVGIGTASPTQMLDVNGTAKANVVQVADGTNSAPSFSFTSAPDTGLFYSSGSGLNISDAGNARFSFYSGGFLGGGANGSIYMWSDAGNAAGPNYSFKGPAGWSDMGMYAPASGNLAFSTSGTERIRVSAAGNVGIGTTSPGSVALDVVGTGANNSALLVPRLTTALRPAGANGMIRYNTNTNKFEFFENNAWVNYGTGASGSTSFPLLASPGTTPATAPSYSFASDSDTGFYSPGAGTTSLATNGTARMTIYSDGNVGIGTESTIGGSLDIVSNTASGKGIALQNKNSSGQSDISFQTDTGVNRGRIWLDNNNGNLYLGSGSTDLVFQASTITGSYEKMRITSAGNIGIGTASPGNVALEVVGTGANNSAVLIPRASTALRPTGANGMIRYNTNTNKFEFFENNAWVNYGTGSGSTSFPLLASPGTTPAGAPSYSFTGDSDTGFFSTGVGTASFATNGTARMTLDSNGNIGVGTAAPDDKIKIVSTLTGPTGLTVYAGNNSGAAAIQLYGVDASGTFGAYPSTYGNTDLNDRIAFITNADASGMVFSAPFATQDIRFSQNNTERMRIDSTGNIGIGTAPGSAALEVAGTGANNSAILIPRNTTALRPAGANGMIRYNTNTNKFEFFENNAWVNYGTGAVGSTSFPLLASPGTTPSTAPSYSFASDSDTGFFSPGAGTASLATNGTARMTVDSTGNVGIGTTTPGADLHVSRNQNASTQIAAVNANNGTNVTTTFYAETAGKSIEMGVNSGNHGYSYLSADSSYVSTTQKLILWVNNPFPIEYRSTGHQFYNQGTEVMRITAAGNVGIGTTSPGSVALDIVGTGADNSAVLIPRNTTALRPAGANGMIRYNTNTNKFEFFENNAWVNYGTGAGGSTSFPLLASPGTTPSTAPSYSFASDSDTGFFSPGAGTASLATNGTARMTVDSTGNVGIGTATPRAALDVVMTGARSAIIVPNDTTANRPTGVNGMIRYNGNLNQVEAFTNNRWAALVDGLASSSKGSLMVGPPGDPDGFGIAGNSASGNHVTVFGAGALSSANSNWEITAIGYGALASSTGGWTNTAVGSLALASNSAGSANVAVGTQAGNNLGPNGAFSGNVIIGDYNSVGMQIDTGADNNVIIGAMAAANLSTGAHNIVIGSNIDVPSATGSNQLNIGNIIYGLAINGTGSTVSSGSVGIGTASPAARLDVFGTGAQSSILIPRDTTANRPTGVNGMVRYNTNTNKFEFFENNAWVNYGTGSSGGSVSFPLLASPGTTPSTAPSYAFASDSDTGFYSPGVGTASLATNGTARMTVDSTGNVGIGTTMPTKTLEVDGEGQFNGGLNVVYSGNNLSQFNGLTVSNQHFSAGAAITLDHEDSGWGAIPNGSSIGQIDFKMADSGNNRLQTDQIRTEVISNTTGAVKTKMVFATANNSTMADRMTILNDGNVGIGTTNPGSAALNVDGTTNLNSAIVIPRATTAARPGTAVNGMIRYNTNTNKFEFFENNAWVNYGTGAGGSVSFPLLASPGTTPSTAPSYAFASDTDTGFYSPGIGTASLATNGTARMTIGSTGNVGIGTTTPKSPLEINGWQTMFDASGSAALMFNSYNSSGDKYLTSESAFEIWHNTWNDVLVFGAAPAGTADASLTFTDALAITATGNVGIGTTSPGNKLDIYGSAPTVIAQVTNISAGGYSFQGLQNDTSKWGGQSLYGSTYSPGASTAYSPDALSLATNATNGITIVSENTSAPIRFTAGGLTAAQERMRITSSGNVGIGTTSPGSVALDVVGTGANNSAILVPRLTTALRPAGANGMIRYNTNTNKFEFFENNAWVNYGTGSGGSVSFPLLASPGTTPSNAPSYSFTSDSDTGFFSPGAGTASLATNGTTRMTIDSTGNVGIGTATPGNLLEVSALSGSVIENIATTNTSPVAGSGSYLTFRGASNVKMAYVGNVIETTTTDSSLIFSTRQTTGNPTEKMRITGAGNVGIGTTSPQSPMHVHNSSSSYTETKYTNSITGAANTDGFNIGVRNDDGRSFLWNFENTDFYIGTNNSERMVVQSSGNVGVGTTSPSARLHVKQDATSFQPAMYLENDGAGNLGRGTGLLMTARTGAGYKTGLAFEDVIGYGVGNLYFLNRTVADTNSADKTDAKMTIDYNGNVGIGTTAPGSAALDVVGTGANNSAILVPRLTTALRPAGSNGMIRYNTNLNYFEAFENGAWKQMITPPGAASFPLLASPGTTPSTAPSYSFTSDSDTGFYSPGAGTASLATNGTARMTVDSTGNVGIGTATPGQKLTVNGRIEAGGGFLLNQGSGATDNLMYLRSTSVGAVDGSLGFFAAGVGSGSAGHGPYFLARGNSFSAISNQRGNMYFYAGNPSSPTSGEGSIVLGTGADLTRLYIAGDGKIGMGDVAGQVSNTHSFEVGVGTDWAQFTGTQAGGVAMPLSTFNTTVGAVGAGSGITFRANSSSSSHKALAEIYGITTDSTTATFASDLVLSTSTAGSISEKVRITSSGNVGIGTTSPETKLTVDGPISLKGPSTINAATYTVATADSSLIFTTTNCTITLPAASSFPGRIIYIKNITANSVTSASSNVVPLASSSAGTAVLAATAGKFAMLQSDGTNWIVMMAN